MVITSIMAFFVVWRLWRWKLWLAFAVMWPLIIIEQVFLAANLLKIFEGGWLPLLIAGVLMYLMLTWVAGMKIMVRQTHKNAGGLDWLARKLEQKPPARVSGPAVFMTATPDIAPTALMHNLKHNRVLHERNIVMAIKTEDVPRVPRHERVEIERVAGNITVVTARYGFMETPSVPKIIDHCRRKDLIIDMPATSFFLSRRSLKPTRGKGLPIWQESAFISLMAIAEDASNYFRIPTDRVVEIGTQVEI